MAFSLPERHIESCKEAWSTAALPRVDQGAGQQLLGAGLHRSGWGLALRSAFLTPCTHAPMHLILRLPLCTLQYAHHVVPDAFPSPCLLAEGPLVPPVWVDGSVYMLQPMPAGQTQVRFLCAIECLNGFVAVAQNQIVCCNCATRLKFA